ncbi:MAG: hypothetical protein ACJ0RQ_16865 [Candidatus Azotimanducaceae bacterium]
MKHRILMGLLLMLLPPLGAQAATGNLVPGEMQACQLNDGVSKREVDKVMTKIADWLEADGHEYDLWMATPHFRPPEGYDFDVLFLGFWTSHAEQMSGLKKFYTTQAGRDIGQSLADVMTCRGNRHFNSVQVRTEAGAEKRRQGFGYMFDCTLASGKGPTDVNEVFQKWNAYLDESDIDHGVSALFPSSGSMESSAESFKFLWGGDFTNVGETLGFLTEPESQATWASITSETYACETFDRGYFFQRISQ